jgi:hypothetical protein
LARENPTDSELPKLMERARFRAVEHALTRAREYRLAGDPQSSQRHFADALTLRRRWNVKLNGALEDTVNDEREDATSRLRALVVPHAQKGEALTAESLVARHAFLLEHEELAALRAELVAASASSGAATCRKLRSTVTAAQPYWVWLVAEYCRHFQSDAPREWPLPDTFSSSKSNLAVAQLGPGVSGALEGRLNALARSGPWFSERGPWTATIATRGAVTSEQRQQPVMLSAGWVERVPYVEHVTKTIEQSVPVQECEAYEESSSSGGKVQKVREVTRHKKMTKEVVVPETRFRDVPRTFEYQAMRVERRASFSGRTELTINDQATATAGHELSDAVHGYSHDVSFEPAHVRPVRPELMPVEVWIEGNANRLANAFAESMRESWRTRFCRGPAYSIEEAARCARVADKVPAAALEGLTPALGADAQLVPSLLSASPLPQKGEG